MYYLQQGLMWPQLEATSNLSLVSELDNINEM